MFLALLCKYKANATDIELKNANNAKTLNNLKNEGWET